MIFKAQYSWLKEYVRVPKNPHDLARQLSLYGPSVERIAHVRHEWNKVVVGEIVKITAHPDADKLQVAIVKDAKGERTLVCGAPNIAVGQKVPLALPGAVLPNGMEIAKRAVRGVESDGMLCSARELGLHDDHVGILILHPASKIGAELKSLGTETDELLEVEPTTNRPDLQSVIGVAREVSAITGEKLVIKTPKALSKSGKSPLTVRVEEKNACLRFAAIVIDGVTVPSSPWWMQERLARAGIRPINAVVDITNYVMIEYGQPMHAFDADKLGHTLVVRRARAGERVQALDGKTYDLEPRHLVVADAEKPVAIAGIMGGEKTGVTEKTTTLVLESATFEPVSVRRTSRALSLSSEASQLFEKGLPTEAPALALARGVELVLQICGGKVQGPMVDVRAKPYRPVSIKFPLSEIKRLLGVDIPASQVSGHLKHLGFTVRESAKVLTVGVPFWREHDVTIPEDLVEEVARLHGYHNFPSTLPTLSLEQAGRERPFAREEELRRRLVSLGFTEVLSYSLIRESWLKALRAPLEKALRVANPLSSELEYMRPSLLPSLVQAIETNAAHASDQRWFEIAAVYKAGSNSSRPIDAYRQEAPRFTAVVVLPGSTPEEIYRQVRGMAEYVLKDTGEIVWGKTSDVWPFADDASADVKVGSERGTVGLLSPGFLSAFGVTSLVAAIDLPLTPLLKRSTRRPFEAIPKFPAVKRDVALVVNRNVSYTTVAETMKRSSPLLVEVELFDTYRGDTILATEQSFAFHLTYRHAERTLTSEEVEAALAAMMVELEQTAQAKLRT